MIDASPFSSLDHATSFELHQWDRRYIAKFGFEFTTSTNTWFSQKILDEVKGCYENTLVVELDITARKEFKLIEQGLERLWERLSRSQIQEASKDPGEVVPDLMEKEDIVSSDGSDEADSTKRETLMLSYDLNKMPEENEYLYSGISPEKKNPWHLAIPTSQLCSNLSSSDEDCLARIAFSDFSNLKWLRLQASHHDDAQILLASGDGIPTTSCPFRLPHSEPRPTPQMSTNSPVHNSEPCHKNLDANTDWVDSLDQEVDDQSFVASGAQSHKGCKTTEFWRVKIIDADGTIKPAKLSMKEAMERPNGKRIVLRFNNTKQAIGDEAGLLSGVLGLLGSDYGKFSICEKSWHKITTKDKFYNECLKEKCQKNAKNRSKQLYTYTGGSKSIARRMEEEVLYFFIHYLDYLYELIFIDFVEYGNGKNFDVTVGTNKEGESVEESYGSQCTKKKDGSYINDEARAIGEKIEEIEQHDESSRVLSQSNSIGQVFGKEKPGRVRGVGFGPSPTQLFGLNSHALGNGVQLEETQRKLIELQAELEGEKLKRMAMEDEATTENKRMKVMESALIYLFQRQGKELPPDIAAGMSFVE
ncbi:hypothetical protein Ahy_B08g090214 [Arachis hypogaea]|uniref:Uncharacterized protein n=1 Tax=Arachis hypogaea TaxID=3818 RepID=A0A444XZS2_ARAHY|nr:hypothetical protein Ahy_B08g090214 [Arachis hypogaea]